MDQTRWKQVEELLQQALDLKPLDRPTFLNNACAGDIGLRRQVETLLNKEFQAEIFIEIPALCPRWRKRESR